MLLVKRLHDNATLPTKAHAGDLGYDLYALKDVAIPPRDIVVIDTGISCQLPIGYGALIRDRSSVATMKGLVVVAGVIDNGYTGEIKIALFNTNKLSEYVHAGSKIAQMILIPTVNFPIIEVENVVSMDGREGRGFGSTDKSSAHAKTKTS